jgi:uncharacterized protein (DUF3084 family)
MSDAMTFTSTTLNTGLPLLVAGQAQKEFFVNQALAILDAFAPGAVVASLSEPPSNPAEGNCYRVIAPASQAWVGCEDHIAIRVGGAWHMVAPREGMRLFDRAADRSLFFQATWQSASTPAAPTDGTVVDAEARTVLVNLIAALRQVGLLGPASP